VTSPRVDPHVAFAELGRIRLGENDLEAVLLRVATLAKDTLGAAEVSVTLVQGARAFTAAFTGELARELDEGQYELGHGPCMDAALSGTSVAITDMTADERWPDFGERATKAGALSSLSIPLPVQESVLGALNCYGRAPNHFGPESLEVGLSFAGYAAVAVANAHLFDTTANLAHHMEAAMATRAVIEQAKGIVMAERRCSPDEAFTFLSLLSQNTNRKLRELARDIVDGVQGDGAPGPGGHRPERPS
jgi:GAF domain-containing protein